MGEVWRVHDTVTDQMCVVAWAATHPEVGNVGQPAAPGGP
jgi:hypothetical protein